MSCIPHNYDIEIHEGATFNKEFRWSITGGSRVSLAGVTGAMQVRKKLTDTDPLLDIPFVAEVWQPDGSTGIYVYGDGSDDHYTIYIKDDDSMGMCANHKTINGVYDLFLYNASGESILKQYGDATIYPAVTR